MGNVIEDVLKEHSAEELIEAAQEKIDDGTLDGVLEKVGIDAEKASGVASFIASAIGLFKKLFGKKKNQEEEIEEEEEEIAEEESDEEEE